MLASWSLWRGTPTRSVHRPERLPTGPTGWTGRAETRGGFAPGFRSPIEMTEDSAFDRPPPTAKRLAANPRTVHRRTWEPASRSRYRRLESRPSLGRGKDGWPRESHQRSRTVDRRGAHGREGAPTAGAGPTARPLAAGLSSTLRQSGRE